MKRYFFFALVVILMAAPALAQMGVKDSIERTLKKAQEEHDENVNQIENPNAQPQNTNQNNAATDAGWMDLTATDVNSTKVRFYVAHPNFAHYGPTPNLPALMVVHEYWGLNDDMVQLTEQFAAKGYYAIAVDMYDGKVTKDTHEAEALEKKMTNANAQLRLKTGLNFLMTQEAKQVVDTEKVGVIGWGLGGTEALILGTADPRIKATVVFYPDLIVLDPAQLQKLKGPVLGIFANSDPQPNSYTVDRFISALEAMKVPHEIHRYDGVGHGFALRSSALPAVFHEEQAKDAWAKTDAWLTANLVKPAATAPATAPAN